MTEYLFYIIIVAGIGAVFGLAFWRDHHRFVADQLSPTQQRDLNFLDNALYDFEHPEDATPTVVEFECADYGRKAERYLKIPRNVSSKVSRYMEYCRARAGKEGGSWKN